MTASHRGTIRIFTLCLALGFAAMSCPVSAARSEEQFSQNKLEAFVTAALAVKRVAVRWAPRMQGVDKSQFAALRNQASTEMIAAITETEGISVQEYRQISTAARKDPKLLERIRTMVHARTKKQ